MLLLYKLNIVLFMHIYNIYKRYYSYSFSLKPSQYEYICSRLLGLVFRAIGETYLLQCGKVLELPYFNSIAIVVRA